MSEALAAIVAWSLQAAALAMATGLALASARVRSPDVRLAAWRLTALAAGTIPFLAAMLAPGHPAVLDTSRLGALAGASPAGGAPGPDLASLLVATLGVIAAGRVLLLLLAWRRLHRWAARCDTIASPVFDAVARQVGVSARLVAADTPTPYTFGRRTPVVAIDARVLEDDTTARAVFYHELAHVARKDWSSVVVEAIVCRVLWFHPAAWWVATEMRVAREEIVDRFAAERLGSRRAYLACLLTLAEASGSVPRSVPAFVNRHHLARRIHALAVEGPMSRPHVLSAFALVAFALSGAAYTGASAVPLQPVTTWSAAAGAERENPVPTKKVQAVYPEDAKAKHVEGEVALDVTIGADGLVKDAVVKKSIPELDAAALTAIRQWEFRPGRLDGKPVEVVVTITFAFTLK